MSGAEARLFPDGRLHLHHGPIDLIFEAFGPPAAVAEARVRAVARFGGILPGLVAELAALRRPASAGTAFADPVARRMQAAVARHLPAFITPMAAVAGAVAEAVLAAAIRDLPLTRAYANNGGDIALHLTLGTRLTAAMAETGGQLTVQAGDGVAGIATSGWRGRSFSFGIADAVTVLAADGAMADAAATLIANAVDLPGHPAIRRTPACTLQPDTDLGDRAVTTGVGNLTQGEVAEALERGARVADAMRAGGLIVAARLTLCRTARTIGTTATRFRLAQDPVHA